MNLYKENISEYFENTVKDIIKENNQYFFENTIVNEGIFDNYDFKKSLKNFKDIKNTESSNNNDNNDSVMEKSFKHFINVNGNVYIIFKGEKLLFFNAKTSEPIKGEYDKIIVFKENDGYDITSDDKDSDLNLQQDTIYCIMGVNYGKNNNDYYIIDKNFNPRKIPFNFFDIYYDEHLIRLSYNCNMRNGDNKINKIIIEFPFYPENNKKNILLWLDSDNYEDLISYDYNVKNGKIENSEDEDKNSFIDEINHILEKNNFKEKIIEIQHYLGNNFYQNNNYAGVNSSDEIGDEKMKYSEISYILNDIKEDFGNSTRCKKIGQNTFNDVTKKLFKNDVDFTEKELINKINGRLFAYKFNNGENYPNLRFKLDITPNEVKCALIYFKDPELADLQDASKFGDLNVNESLVRRNIGFIKNGVLINEDSNFIYNGRPQNTNFTTSYSGDYNPNDSPKQDNNNYIDLSKYDPNSISWSGDYDYEYQKPNTKKVSKKEKNSNKEKVKNDVEDNKPNQYKDYSDTSDNQENNYSYSSDSQSNSNNQENQNTEDDSNNQDNNDNQEKLDNQDVSDNQNDSNNENDELNIPDYDYSDYNLNDNQIRILDLHDFINAQEDEEYAENNVNNINDDDFSNYTSDNDTSTQNDNDYVNDDQNNDNSQDYGNDEQNNQDYDNDGQDGQYYDNGGQKEPIKNPYRVLNKVGVLRSQTKELRNKKAQAKNSLRNLKKDIMLVIAKSLYYLKNINTKNSDYENEEQ